jgi:hypothetical protein
MAGRRETSALDDDRGTIKRFAHRLYQFRTPAS